AGAVRPGLARLAAAARRAGAARPGGGRLRPGRRAGRQAGAEAARGHARRHRPGEGLTAVRTLLIASPKGGVGTTTTAINLAAAPGAPVLVGAPARLGGVPAALTPPAPPARLTLRAAGLGAEGTTLRGVAPRLDVFPVPYADAAPDEDALAVTLAHLRHDFFR